jgi:type II secretory pathway component PulF
MPVFTYTAVDDRGRQHRGTMPALSESQLEEKLGTTGVWLLEAIQQRAPSTADAAAKSRRGWTGAQVKRRDLIEFCTLMCFQARVGVPLMHALDVASQDCENPVFRKILGSLKGYIESGLLFYESLEKYPRVFTPHFISVIRAGEMSSKLPEAFDDLRAYLEWVDRMIAEVRQASLYPAIVSLVVFGFVVGLFTFIIPKFAELLSSVNAKLPFLTQVVFGVSGFMASTWWFWLLVIPGLVIALMVARKTSKRVALWFDEMKLRMPIFGELNWMLAISRFTHNLAILYRSGIPILNSLHLCQGLIGSTVVEKAVAAVEEAVKAGSTISEALRRHPVFPPLLIRMVVMGETTGKLDEALDNVSEYYSEIIPRRIKKVLTVLEPALTLFLIGVVGCVALSIYLPILSLMGTIR